MNKQELDRIIAEDHRDASMSAEMIDKAKDFSTRVIEHIIAELEYELRERDPKYGDDR